MIEQHVISRDTIAKWGREFGEGLVDGTTGRLSPRERSADESLLLA
jgi:hypothetical protein